LQVPAQHALTWRQPLPALPVKTSHAGVDPATPQSNTLRACRLTRVLHPAHAGQITACSMLRSSHNAAIACRQ
jgi:chitodextrinase